MTSRIYYTEPWRREFDAVVTGVDQDGARLRVRLDRTAFYPTSGGQPFDTGTLGGLVVHEVADDADGAVAHVVQGVLQVGQVVHGEVDWPRRFDHMQQHTGQHVLSAAFDRLHGARTESFHLGAESATIHLGREVSAVEIAAAEDDANRVVWDDRPVTIRFVDADEASRLPLRKEAARSGPLRLIDIEDADLSACGGTHVSRTGEIGMIAVRGWERFRGGTRVEFVCGRRALGSYRVLRDAVTGAVRRLSVLPGELPDGIERLQAETKELKKGARDLAQKLAGYEAEVLASHARETGGARVVVEAVEGYDASGLKALALAIVSRPGPGLASVLFTTTRPALVVAARGAGLTSPDCAALLRQLVERFGGRGGGKPDIAQGGGLEAAPGDLVAAAKAALEM